MKKIHLQFYVAVVFGLPAFQLWAEELPNYFAAPITTALQRAQVSSDEDVYLEVRCRPLVDKAQIKLAELPASQFSEGLRELAQGHGRGLKMVLRYEYPNNVSKESKASLRGRLENLAREAGFEQVATREISTTGKWNDQFAAIAALKDRDLPDREPLFEDARIRAYPVRTSLSKFVVGDADCLIEIRQPFDGRHRELSQPLRESIIRAVRKMDLGPQKGRLKFDLSSTASGQPLLEELFHSRRPVTIPPGITDPALIAILAAEAGKQTLSPAMQLARELGFESIFYTHTPGGGSPERLIGTVAPNFKLPTLDGTPLEFHAFRQGRPVLLTFWGVACGPCRREAPHLSRLADKYGPRGFAVLAVNGYDEKHEDVAAYIKQAKLTHSIALQGGKVADDLYFVGAYPTSFWINRDGVVEDYVVDFDSGKAIERRILGMLEK